MARILRVHTILVVTGQRVAGRYVMDADVYDVRTRSGRRKAMRHVILALVTGFSVMIFPAD